MKILMISIAALMMLAGCGDKERIAELEKTVKEKDAVIAQVAVSMLNTKKTIQSSDLVDVMEKSAQKEERWQNFPDKPNIPGYSQARLSYVGVALALDARKRDKRAALNMIYVLEDAWPDRLSFTGQEYKPQYWQCRDFVALTKLVFEIGENNTWNPNSVEHNGLMSSFSHAGKECRDILLDS